MTADELRLGIKKIMCDVLDLDISAIHDGTSVENTPRWDSANHIQLALALEEEFSVSFEVTELESMLSFGDIVRTLQGKL